MTAVTERKVTVWLCHAGRQIIWDGTEHRHVGRGALGSPCDHGLADIVAFTPSSSGSEASA